MDNKNYKNKNLGKMGEKTAEEFLKKRGYKIINRNFRTRWGEIDLVCKEKNLMVFVEVKTRIGERFGLPEDAFNRDKLLRLCRNAKAYMNFRAKEFSNYRIDGVCIVINEFSQTNKVERIDHYENIISDFNLN